MNQPVVAQPGPPDSTVEAAATAVAPVPASPVGAEGPLAPIFRGMPSGRSCGLSVTPPKPVWNQNASAGTVAFYAGVVSAWPSGWVPLFEVEKAGRMELRRLPLQGQENSSTPLFFVLPLEQDRTARAIAGRWVCHAHSPQRSNQQFVLELTTSGDQVVGRLDQNSEYRFASITGGSFRTNHLELTLQYVSDRYHLEANLQDGDLSGTWRQLNGDEHGVWDAVRDAAVEVPTSRPTAMLHEWRRASDGSRSYHLPNAALGPEWQRQPVPLGRVWLPAPVPKPPTPGKP